MIGSLNLIHIYEHLVKALLNYNNFEILIFVCFPGYLESKNQPNKS